MMRELGSGTLTSEAGSRPDGQREFSLAATSTQVDIIQ